MPNKERELVILKYNMRN